MMVYDNTTYSWWLPVFSMEMSSFLQEHCKLIKETIDWKVYSFLFSDLWINISMSKGS